MPMLHIKSIITITDALCRGYHAAVFIPARKQVK